MCVVFLVTLTALAVVGAVIGLLIVIIVIIVIVVVCWSVIAPLMSRQPACRLQRRKML